MQKNPVTGDFQLQTQNAQLMRGKKKGREGGKEFINETFMFREKGIGQRWAGKEPHHGKQKRTQVIA